MTRPQALAVALVFGGGGSRVCGRLRTDERGDAIFREESRRGAVPRSTALTLAATLGAGCSSSSEPPVVSPTRGACLPTATIALATAPGAARDVVAGAPVAVDVDSDGDGLLDGVDKCPTEAAQDASDGCPTRRVIVTTAGGLMILQHVTFGVSSSAVGKESAPILDATVDVIRTHPELTHIVIEGHADAAERSPERVSLSRAKAVVEYLVKKGADRAVLEARGAGSQKPLADNATPAGRARNRRVDFLIQ